MRQRHQIHVVERHLRQLADVGLYKNGGLGGVDAAGQIVQRHLHDVVADLLGMVEVVGEGLRVGDHLEKGQCVIARRDTVVMATPAPLRS